MASSLILLLMAGVLIRFLQSWSQDSPGYDVDRIYELKLDRPKPAMIAALEQEPAVASVTAVERVLLYGDLPHCRASAAGRSFRLSYNHVDSNFFETLRLSVVGRGFARREAGTNARVVVISRSTARMLWPESSPLGRSIVIDDEQAGGSYEVIGVVPDISSGWLFRGKDTTAAYLPAAAGQEAIQDAMVRINGNAAGARAAIRKICSSAAD